jgi:coenzyme F420-reducing hydrogenase beta subunit
MDKDIVRTVCEQDMCCGCMACVETCHKDAINVVDSLRAFNAEKNDNCVGCGLCERVCPQNNVPIANNPIAWNQGWAKDEKTRIEASSGGYASAISKAFVKNGGWVCIVSYSYIKINIISQNVSHSHEFYTLFRLAQS